MNNWLKSALATLLYVVSLGSAGGQQPDAISNPAYANTLREIQQAKTLSYTVTHFIDGEDGSLQVSLVTESEHRSPNLYRETRFDENRNVRTVDIVDTNAKKQLRLDMQAKTATWLDQPVNVYGPGSPLEMLASFIKKMPVDAAGQRETNEGKADVFEVSSRLSLWFDTESRDLVGFSMSKLDQDFSPQLSDLGKSPVRHGAAMPIGQVRSDIQYGEDIREERFKMEVPRGFEVVE